MQKKKLKTFGLTLIAFALSLFATQAQVTDVMLVNSADGGSSDKVALNNIQRITFSANDLNVITFDGRNFVCAYENIGKIVFDSQVITDVANSLVTGSNALVYITSAGELVVENFTDIKSLTLLSIDGKILQKAASSPMYINSLPASVYLLLIDSAQGVIARKIVKQ